MDNSTSTSKKVELTGLLNLFVVYIVWGSTYLAIRVAVREGAGFPPFFLGGLRITLAGILLILWFVFKKRDIRLSKQNFIRTLVPGILLWVGGNGLVSLAETRADSNLAALIIGATPLWVAIIETILDKKWPSILLVIGLLIGLGGIFTLSFPTLQEKVSADVVSIVLLLIAGLSWGSGTIFQQRKPADLPVGVNAAYQQFFGGIGLFAISFLLVEPKPIPIPEAWIAFAYLLIFGSLFAFTAFVRAVQLLPMNIVMTYPYVNPVIAVILGWLILREEITIYTIVGTLFVIISVAIIFHDKRLQQAKERIENSTS